MEIPTRPAVGGGVCMGGLGGISQRLWGEHLRPGLVLSSCPRLHGNGSCCKTCASVDTVNAEPLS